MNILYLAHRIPYPPDKGDKLRAYHQINHLAKNHRVWCACFVDREEDMRFVPILRSHCHALGAIPLSRTRAVAAGAFGLMRGATLTESFYEHHDMGRLLHKWSSQVDFDAVLAFSSGMAPYAMKVRAVHRVLDACDLDSLKWAEYAGRSSWPLRNLYAMEGRRLASRERDWAEQFDAVILITREEAGPLLRTGAADRVHVVGNGVHVPENNPWEESGAMKPIGQPATVGFIGVMDYPPNVDAVCWFARDCWPMIRHVFSSAIFRISGRRPLRRVRSLARIPGVEIIGAFDNVQAELRLQDVSVAPLRIARGLQNKVLEAMAAAKPIVLTSVAAAGLTVRDGEHCLVADTAESFAARVLDILVDPGRGRCLGEAARNYVLRNHVWENELTRLESILTRRRETSNRPLLREVETCPQPALVD